MKSSTVFPAVSLLGGILLGLLVAIPLAHAQEPPAAMAYQGYLTDTDGDALGGTVNLAFALYDVAADGTALWEESQARVSLDDGIFSVMLGSVEALDGVDFSGPLYLGVRVNGGRELAPRVPLGVAPISLVARAVAPGGAVRSINGLTDEVTLAAGDNITLTEADGTITLDAVASFALPFDGENTTNEPGVRLTNSGANFGISVIGSGVGALQAVGTGAEAMGIFTSASGSNPALSAYTSGSGTVGQFTQNNTASASPALSVSTNGQQSPAGVFSLTNEASEAYAVEATSAGTRGAGLFRSTSSELVDATLKVESEQSLYGIHSLLSGTCCIAGYFQVDNPNHSGAALWAQKRGFGAALQVQAQDASDGVVSVVSGTGRAAQFLNSSASHQANLVEISTAGSGDALYAVQASNGTGRAAHFETLNTANSDDVLFVETDGTGSAGHFQINSAENSKPAFLAETGGTGTAGRFVVTNQNNNANGLEVTTFGTGTALLAVYSGAGAGDVARFKKGAGNVARINDTGRGFFNGGTQNSGADIAEAFAVEGTVAAYEPGDVLVISTRTDRTVEKSTEAYSTLVVGVYATKPGVLLTERGIDESLDDTVPMGVVGVIPTKVSGENGSIRRGDLLVTSATPGHAMKADPEALRVGTVLGKALQNFEGRGLGLINVLVNVK